MAAAEATKDSVDWAQELSAVITRKRLVEQAAGDINRLMLYIEAEAQLLFAQALGEKS